MGRDWDEGDPSQTRPVAIPNQASVSCQRDPTCRSCYRAIAAKTGIHTQPKCGLSKKGPI